MRTITLHAPLLGSGRSTSAMALAAWLAQGRRVVVGATEVGRSSLCGSGQPTPLAQWANRVTHLGQELRP